MSYFRSKCLIISMVNLLWRISIRDFLLINFLTCHIPENNIIIYIFFVHLSSRLGNIDNILSCNGTTAAYLHFRLLFIEFIKRQNNRPINLLDSHKKIFILFSAGTVCIYFRYFSDHRYHNMEHVKQYTFS